MNSADADIVIKDNVFKANAGVQPKQRRFIHVQTDGNVDFKITVTGNKFTGIDNLDNGCAVEVYSPADFGKVNISGNYLDGNCTSVCIANKEGSNWINHFDASTNWLDAKGQPVIINAAINADSPAGNILLCSTLAVALDKSAKWTGNLCIMNEAGLRDFSTLINSGKTFEGKTVLLMNDIDLKDANWIPAFNSISSYSSEAGFTGTFDGRNHTIKNMTCSSSDPNYAAAGFIGAGHCTIQNLTLENVNVSSTHYAGAFVGYASANITLRNCIFVEMEINSFY